MNAPSAPAGQPGKPGTSSPTLPAVRWDAVPARQRLWLADVPTYPGLRPYGAADYQSPLSSRWPDGQCAAAVEETYRDRRDRPGETRYTGKYRRCQGRRQRGRTMCWQHRHLEPGRAG